MVAEVLAAALQQTADPFVVASLLRSAAGRIEPVSADALEQYGRDAAKAATTTLRRQLPGSNRPLSPGAAPFGSVDDLVTAFARNLADAIAVIDRNVFNYAADRIERAAREAAEPLTPAQIRAAVSSRKPGSPASHLRHDADFVAGDTLGSLTSAINRRRMQETGVRYYEWRSQRDSRVRDEHFDLDGTRWLVDGPGHITEGHPGDPPNCRCYAVPVLE